MQRIRRSGRALAMLTAGAFLALGAPPSGALAQASVAIANFGPHGSLQQVIDGFKQALADNGYVEGEGVVYDYSDGNFDPSLIPQILSSLEAGDPDLMFTITTPVSQAAVTLVRDQDIPIVFAPVTDPVNAGLVPSWEQGSDRFVGASNMQSTAAVLDFAATLLGRDIDSFGVLFNPGDANDVVGRDLAQAEADARDIELVAVSVESPNDIQQRVTALGDVDFIYAIPSSMLQPALPAVASAADRAGIPIISSSPQGVEQHVALAAMSVPWDQVGYEAGVRAARILDGAAPSDLDNYRPTPEDHAPAISLRRMEHFGLEVPDALADCGCLIE